MTNNTIRDFATKKSSTVANTVLETMIRYHPVVPLSHLQMKEYELVRNQVLRRESQQRYNDRNRDKINESKRKYYATNKDFAKESNRDYYLKNKDKKREYDHEYRLLNKPKIRDSKRRNYLRKLENSDSYRSLNSESKSWKTPETVRSYFDSIAGQLSISDPTDWYRISRVQIRDFGGLSLYRKFGGLAKALQFAYPDVDWDLSKFPSVTKKSEQRLLKIKIEEILPGIEIIENYQHPNVSWGRFDSIFLNAYY